MGEQRQQLLHLRAPAEHPLGDPRSVFRHRNRVVGFQKRLLADERQRRHWPVSPSWHAFYLPVPHFFFYGINMACSGQRVVGMNLNKVTSGWVLTK